MRYWLKMIRVLGPDKSGLETALQFASQKLRIFRKTFQHSTSPDKMFDLENRNNDVSSNLKSHCTKFLFKFP